MQPTSDFSSPREKSTAARLFMVQENLIMLGGSALFSLALASPVPLAAAFAGELVWLGVGSSSPRVRRWLDERKASLGQVASAPASSHALDSEYARRVLTLDRALATIRGFGGPRPQPAFGHAVTRLETLRPVYFGLCETHQRIGRFLAATTEGQLVAEAERLKAQFAAEKDLGLRLTLRQAIGAVERHVEHRHNMAQLQRGIGVKLESVERSMAYLVSQGFALGSNPAFTGDVEALLSEIGPAIAVDVESVRQPSLAPAPDSRR